jgi:adenylate cyclase
MEVLTFCLFVFVFLTIFTTVNIAMLMESQGVPGHIQVSADTYEMIKYKYTSSEIRTIEGKGKGKMVAYLFPPK